MSGNSDRYANLHSFRNGTEEQRQWLRAAQLATEWIPGTGEGNRPVEWQNFHAIHALGNRALSRGPEGTRQIAWALLELGLKELPRPVRSGLLTLLVRLNLEGRFECQDYPTDGSVSAFGPMVMDLVAASETLVLEWLADLSVGSPLAGLDPQPSPIIRGLFLAPSASLIKVSGFWEAALELPEFPERIFIDPSHATNGIVFSAYLIRRFAEFFDYGPRAALERLIPLIRDRADRKSVWASDSREQRCQVRIVPASAEERSQMQRRLVAAMTVPERRELAGNLMFPDGIPAGMLQG
jgi:hypothetical protein